ncbi:DUF6268 family outer membrane beta-barrel protein [uncultured Eudoraea sp.]|uniref:DUF6268 family outer membrane beta-barrel protein n=1 Tax=uncultured Eudoraea sp. TaxID=1035614 RepID=UPI002628A459|nr:DUF6268 family outer membrane beta-barrel protein [uncultured Eudoraea sp.]
MVKRIGLFWCLLIVSGICFAQSTDILRVEYTSLPREETGNTASRYRFLLNVPVKVGFDKYLVLGGEFNLIDFEITKEYPFDSSELNTLYVIDLNVGYIFKLNEDWRFVGIVTPRIASNLVNGLQGDDFLLNLTATIWKEEKDIDKPYRLILGLTYNSTTGLPFPLPLINYHRRFHRSWSYSLGIPRTDFRYHFKDRHTLQMALFLDGYFVNVQNDILLPDGEFGSSVSLSAIVSAIGYQYNINRRMSFYGIAGVTLNQQGLLRNAKRKKVYTLNEKNAGGFYWKAGFKISIF